MLRKSGLLRQDPEAEEQEFRKFHYERLILGRDQAELSVVFLWLLIALWEFLNHKVHQPFEEVYPVIVAGRLVVLGLILGMIFHRRVLRPGRIDPTYLENQYAAGYLCMLGFWLVWLRYVDPMAVPIEGFAALLTLIVGGPALFGPTVAQQRRLTLYTVLLLCLGACMAWWSFGTSTGYEQRAIVHGLVVLCMALTLAHVQIRVLERRSRARFRDVKLIRQQDAELQARAERLTELNLRLEEALSETKTLSQRVADAKVAQLAERAKLFKQLAQYVAGVVHDLRQPLQAMSLQMKPVKQALHAGDIETAERLLTRSERAVQSLQSQVTSLLESATLQARDRPLRLQVVDLNALLQFAADMHRSHAEDRGVLMHCVPRAPAVFVRTDATLLSRVVSNLIHNAIKFSRCDESDHGLVQVSVYTQSEVKVIISIQNSGPLMSAHVLQAMREGQSADMGLGGAPAPADDVPSEGFGLGLVIVQNLIARLPGHALEVHSSADQGNIFRILMPYESALQVQDSQTASADLQETLPGIEAETQAWLKGRYVLVLDDDPASAHEVEQQLTRAHVVVRCLTQESEVLALARDDQARMPDLLLFDYSLGGGRTGPDVVRGVRELGWECPVVIFTGDPTFYDLFKDSKLMPALQKPLVMDMLLPHLRELWSGA